VIRRALGVAFVVASASVQAQVTALADLRFGTVVAGVPESVLPTSSDAANWRIHYTLLAVASNFQLTLPTQMARAGGGTGMPVSFCSTCGVYRINNSSPAGGTTFNPANQVNLPLLVVNSNVYIWLGGTASPGASQSAGSYSGTVILTLSGVIL
jgi:hypothetical protein